jgi:hypothetical protein
MSRSEVLHEDYYVYLHRRNDTNEVFYVGKGRGNRAWNKSHRSFWWRSIVNKCDYTVEIEEKCLSEQSAFDLEIELIKFYKENNHPLCNMTLGGDGASGCIRSAETLAKMSESRKRFNVNNPITEAQKEHMSKIKKAQWAVESDKLTTRNIIECSNGMVFTGTTSVVAWLKCNGYPTANMSGISRCCSGVQETAYNLKWWYIGVNNRGVVTMIKQPTLEGIVMKWYHAHNKEVTV